jgi:hypothetical protein
MSSLHLSVGRYAARCQPAAHLPDLGRLCRDHALGERANLRIGAVP